MAKDLVQIIKDNPGCVVLVDNDSWSIERRPQTPEGFDEWPSLAQDEWWEKQVIARSDDKFTHPEHGANCYGEGVLNALADIVGIHIEGV